MTSHGPRVLLVLGVVAGLGLAAWFVGREPSEPGRGDGKAEYAEPGGAPHLGGRSGLAGTQPPPERDPATTARPNSSGPEAVRGPAGGDTIEGTVTDPAGEPVEGAVVDFVAEQGRVDPGVWLTDAEGRFRATVRYDRDQARRLRARARGFVPGASASVQPGGPPVTIQLEMGRVLVGEVQDPGGAPVEGARVVLEARRSYQRSFANEALRQEVLDWDGWGLAVTDAAGRFVLQDLPAGRVALRATAEGRWAPSPPTPVADPPGRVVLTLRAGHVLEGMVVDPEGEPVEGAHVALAEVREAGWVTRTDGVTDEHGRFRYGGLLPGRTTVRVEAGGYLPKEVGDVEIGRDPLWIALEELRSLELRVVDGASGRPLPSATVVVLDVTGRSPDTDTSYDEETGLLEVRGLAEGLYHLVVIAVGHADAVVPGVRAGGRLADVRMRPGRTISGHCEVAGSPASFDVYAVPADGRAVPHVPRPRLRFPASRWRSGDGMFRIEGLADGEYDLVVLTFDEDPALASVVVPRVAAGTTGLVVAVPPGVSIHALVRAADGGEETAVAAEAYDDRGLCRSWWQRGDSTHPTLELGGLAPGRYDLVLTTSRGRKVRIQAVEAPAQDRVFVLPP